MHIYIVILILIFSGCSIYNEGLEELNSFTNSNIEYTYDGGADYFQSPTETLELGTGDCEDFTLLFMYLANEEYNVKPDMQIAFIEHRGNHALAYYDGIYYDPTNNLIFDELPEDWHPIIRWSYDVIMIYATGFYTKGELNVNTERL